MADVIPLKRQCGSCTLCCKLLPMQGAEQPKEVDTKARMRAAGIDVPDMIPVFDKAAGARCPHQRHKAGCTVYDRRPFGCRYWECLWLSGDDTADMRRPDRAHYVLDPAIDYITVVAPSGERIPYGAVQVWVDRDYPDAHRDPVLRAFIERRGREGWVTIIRYSHDEAFPLVPPSMADDGQWHEVRDRTQIDRSRQYNLNHITAVLSGKVPA
jgi:hypothetical protein